MGEMMKAITPAEAQKYKEEKIPRYVYEAFNTLIKKDFNGICSLVLQNDAIEEIMQIGPLEVSRQFIFDNNLLDVVFNYTQAGWLVQYTSEGTNGAFYIFSKAS